MRQTRTQSFIEACVGTVIGLGVAVLANWLILPLFGFDASWGQSVWIAIVFTVISCIRSYLIRRLFNWYHHLGA